MEFAGIWGLVETSINVALGACIAGFAVWVASRKTKSTQSSAHNRRLLSLEEISSQVGNVSHIFAKYSSLVIESVHFGAQWPEARKHELDYVNKELVAEFKKMANAEAKLLLLGEKNMERALRLYGAKIASFRKQVYVGRSDISVKEIGDLKQEISKLREQFYDMLSEKYDRLLST